MLNSYAPRETPGLQPEAAEINSQPEPVDLRKAFSLVNGKILSKDYEARLFIFGRDDLVAGKTRQGQDVKETDDSQVQPLNTFAQAAKEQNSKSFTDAPEFDRILLESGEAQNTGGFHVQAIYIFAYNHKAINLACLKSDHMCNTKEEGHSAATDDLFEQIFFFDKFAKDDKAMSKMPVDKPEFEASRFMRSSSTDPELFKKSVINHALEILTTRDQSRINDPTPTYGFKALYLLSDRSGKKMRLKLRVGTATLPYSPEQLSELLNTLPGKQIREYLLRPYL